VCQTGFNPGLQAQKLHWQTLAQTYFGDNVNNSIHENKCTKEPTRRVAPDNNSRWLGINICGGKVRGSNHYWITLIVGCRGLTLEKTGGEFGSRVGGRVENLSNGWMRRHDQRSFPARLTVLGHNSPRASRASLGSGLLGIRFF
jgi:hypothetical protein